MCSVLNGFFTVLMCFFISLISMPFISFERIRLIALPRVSIPIADRMPERGQPCLTPLSKLNCLVAKPLLKMQLEMSLNITFIHCRNCSLQNRRDFLRILGEPTRKRGEREARVTRAGRSAKKSGFYSGIF